jgi:TolA-binding protein
MQERYTRESLVDYLIIWEVFSAEARDLGLDKDRSLRAKRIQSDDGFWAGIYRDSVLPATWEEKPADLEKAFKANRALFTRDADSRDWKPHARDIAAWMRLTERDFEIEYHTNPERYTRDSVRTPLAEARPAVFENLKPAGYGRLDAVILEKLKQRFKVRIEDPTLLEPSLEPVAETYKMAQDLHYDRKLDQALGLYEQLRTNFPANAGLQDSVSFGVAQIYIEQERFAQALAEYRRVSYLYPKSPNDYKAMFMVGFIQAEHLRQDSAAVRSFEAMLTKYPDSDLSDDADWMIRNIRSGGQLMPALDDDMDEGDASK